MLIFSLWKTLDRTPAIIIVEMRLFQSITMTTL